MEIVHQHEQEKIERMVSKRYRRVRVSHEYATAQGSCPSHGEKIIRQLGRQTDPSMGIGFSPDRGGPRYRFFEDDFRITKRSPGPSPTVSRAWPQFTAISKYPSLERVRRTFPGSWSV